MGGGLPAAGYGGPATLMSRLAPDGPIYQAGTLSGNPLAMAAGIATLKLDLTAEGAPERLVEAARGLAAFLDAADRGTLDLPATDPFAIAVGSADINDPYSTADDRLAPYSSTGSRSW